MTVGLVLVSHVADIAAGVRALVAQMAPDVAVAVAGGTEDGRVGTSFDLVAAALTDADSGSGVVVLYDLGSAQMTAEMAVEVLGEEERARVRVVDAPLVEGALAAATTAQGGADVDAVAAAAGGARPAGAAAAGEAAAPDEPAIDEPATEPAAEVTARRTLPNPLGLHARPAADLVRALAGFDATVRVGPPGASGVDVRGVLAVVGLGLRGGTEVEVRAHGADARPALDAVTAMIDDGFGELGEAQEPTAAAEGVAGAPPPEALQPGAIRGVPGASGRTAGPLRRLRVAEPELPERAGSGSQTERDRLDDALAQVDAGLARRAAETGTSGDLAAAHRALLADPALRDGALAAIADGESAESGWWKTVRAAGAELGGADALAAERGADVREVGLAVLAALGVPTGTGLEPGDTDLSGAVVAIDELLPGQVAELVATGVAGIVSARGGPTAHATILARGFGLPLVVGTGAAIDTVADGTPVLVDGTNGTVLPDPGEDQLQAVRTEAAERERRQQEERTAAAGPVIRPDGERVIVAANIVGVEDARLAVESGADGVGLLRTELRYASSATVPSEDEQAAELAEVLGVLGDRSVVVRTLDVGGDKPMPALDLDPIRHGMLGERGLRYGRTHPELLHTQLRAILRAGADFSGELAVMAPMVTVPDEAREFRASVEAAATELAEQGVAAGPVSVGVMVEVPAAALAADELCAHVDFVSVGSNDLAQYVLAADRTNDAVAHLYRPDAPPVWRLIELLVAGARVNNCPVAVCGEIAGQPELAERLVGLGVTELSMAPAAIPAVKAHLRATFGAAEVAEAAEG